MTRAQKRAWHELWPVYGVEYRHGQPIDLRGLEAPFALEIGFGLGDHLIHLAQQHPDQAFLGIETHKPGIAAALQKAAAAELNNLRLIRGDGRLVLTDYLGDRSLSEVYVLFPDPWPKPADAHRRLIQDQFVELLEQRLEPGGRFVFSTDVTIYREHAQSVFNGRGDWIPLAALCPRPLTKYEQIGLKEGRQIHNLGWSYQPQASAR